MRRSVVVLVASLIGAFAVMGAATTLGVDSKKVDSFTADQPATTVPGDTTPPSLVSLQMFDTGPTPNGKVDQVVATFSEALQGVTEGPAGFSLSATPSAGSLSDVEVSDGSTTATLTITEGAGTADTAVGDFKVSLAFASSTIKDAAGNKASFAATSPADKARPLPMLLSLANGGSTAGRAEQGDTVTVTWSEPLLAGSICTEGGLSDAATQTVTGNSGNASIRIKDQSAAPTSTFDTLDATFACGLNFGSVSLGSTAYVATTRTFGGNAGADRSSATWNPVARAFQLTLGTPSGATATVSSSVAVYTPDEDLEDLAGNKVPSAPAPPFTRSTALVAQL